MCGGGGTDLAHNWRGDWEIVGLEVNLSPGQPEYPLPHMLYLR